MLNTNPTPSGEDTLDPFHPYGITKHLVDKKVQTLENHDTWLRVQAAERQGLITSTITYPEKQLAVSSQYWSACLVYIISALCNELQALYHGPLHGHMPLGTVGRALVI